MSEDRPLAVLYGAPCQCDFREGLTLTVISIRLVKKGHSLHNHTKQGSNKVLTDLNSQTN
jgi:hypothetical protein